MPLYAGTTFSLAISTGDLRPPNPQPQIITKGTIGGWSSGHTIFQSNIEPLTKSPVLAGANPKITHEFTRGPTAGLPANPLITQRLTFGVLYGIWYQGHSTFASSEIKIKKSLTDIIVASRIGQGVTIGTLSGWSAGQTTFQSNERKLAKGAAALQISNPRISALINTGTFGRTFSAIERRLIKGMPTSPTSNPLINPLFITGSMGYVFVGVEEKLVKSELPGQIPNPLISHALAKGSLSRIFTGIARQLMRSKLPAGIPNPIISHAIISSYWGGLPVPRTKVYVYYGNNAAITESDWSKVDPDLPELSGTLGSLEIQHLTSGRLLVEHPAIKRIEFYDKNDALVAQIDGISDFSAGRIIKRVKQDLNLQAAVSYIRVITAADKAQTFYI